MGRIRTQLIKRITEELVTKYEFKTGYKENKELLRLVTDVPSKKLRNVLAGSVTNAMKHREQ